MSNDTDKQFDVLKIFYSVKDGIAKLTLLTLRQFLERYPIANTIFVSNSWENISDIHFRRFISKQKDYQITDGTGRVTIEFYRSFKPETQFCKRSGGPEHRDEHPKFKQIGVQAKMFYSLAKRLIEAHNFEKFTSMWNGEFATSFGPLSTFVR